MSQSSRDYTEVPIKFNGTLKIVKGVSKYTTCGDVIKMVLKKANISKKKGSSEAFGIYESSRGIERLVPGKSRLLKVMRSWEKHDDYEFVFRKVNTAFAATKMSEAYRRKLTNQHRMFRLASIADNKPQCKHRKSIINGVTKEIGSNDSGCAAEKCSLPQNAREMDMYRNATEQSDDHGFVRSEHAFVNMNANDVKYAVRKTLKAKSCNVSELYYNLNTKEHQIYSTPNSNVWRKASMKIKRHETLAFYIANQVARMNDRVAKEALLQKYFADYITYRSPGYTYSDSRFRERGDGAESTDEVFLLRQGDGSECACSTPKSRTRRSPLVVSDTEDSVDSGQEEEFSNFDVAFISDTPYVNEFICRTPHVSPERGEKLINANYDVDVDHNLACARRLVDYSLSEISTLTDSSDASDISSDNIVDNVSSASDIVRATFKEDRQLSEVDEMESVMKSKVYDDLSDEGLSSLGSDDEIEVMV